MSPSSQPSLQAAFRTTRWTRVCLAKIDSEDGRGALADLCDAYYQPVMAFLLCRLRDADAARDLAHAFFASVLAGGTMRLAEPEHGRFRSYLLGAVKHFLAHQHEAALRLKRGGGQENSSLDDTAALDLADPHSPTSPLTVSGRSPSSVTPWPTSSGSANSRAKRSCFKNFSPGSRGMPPMAINWKWQHPSA